MCRTEITSSDPAEMFHCGGIWDQLYLAHLCSRSSFTTTRWHPNETSKKPWTVAWNCSLNDVSSEVQSSHTGYEGILTTGQLQLSSFRHCSSSAAEIFALIKKNKVKKQFIRVSFHFLNYLEPFCSLLTSTFGKIDEQGTVFLNKI